MHGMQWQLKGRLIFGLKGRMKEVLMLEVPLQLRKLKVEEESKWKGKQVRRRWARKRRRPRERKQV